MLYLEIYLNVKTAKAVLNNFYSVFNLQKKKLIIVSSIFIKFAGIILQQ